MTMLDDGAVETVDRPATRSPDTKAAALAYLTASGATAITITEHDGVCSFHVGHKIDPRAAMVQWLPETNAREIVKTARRGAGKNPDVVTAMSALAKAAADLGVTLTANNVAMARAGAAAERLDAYIESLRARGAR